MTFKGVSDAASSWRSSSRNRMKQIQMMLRPNPQIGHRIYHIPFSGEKEEQIAAYSNQEAQCAVYGDSLYYVESQSGRGLCLFRINPQTKERKLLAEHLAAEPSSTASEPLPEDVVFRNLVDDWLIMNILTKEYIAENKNIELVFTGVAVNTASGESRKISLTNYFNATTAPIEILAQTRGKPAGLFRRPAAERRSSPCGAACPGDRANQQGEITLRLFQITNRSSC